MDKQLLKQIKQDYCEQLFLYYGLNDVKATRNIDRILQCKFVEDSRLGDTLCSDCNTNTITYGPMASIHHFYHELDHLRKGICRTGGTIRYVRNQNGQMNWYISFPEQGIFFDEGITEYMAQKMFKNSKLFKNHPMKNEDFYGRQLQVLDELSKGLNISGLELCRLIDLRQHFNDNHEIDDLLKNHSHGQVTFDELQKDLDWWGTWQKQELVSNIETMFFEFEDGHKERVYGGLEEGKQFTEQKFSHAYFLLGQIKSNEPAREM